MSDINVTVQDEIVNIDVIDEPVLVNVVNSPGQQGPAGPGVPVGGTAGQILAKASATNYDTEWINNYAKYLATNVRNQTGSTIGAFQVVYISGATGNKPLISLADADTEATSSKTYGVTASSIANNGTGDVVTAGELSGIDTSAFNEGDLLWLSTTAGGVVTTPPAEPAHAVFIGYVVRSHPTLGTIDVSIQNGYELNELHGVQITTPTDNQGLFYNSTSTLWENKSITTALGYTPVPTTRNITINGVTYDLSADRTYTISTGISGSGAAGQVTYWTGASAVSGSNNLFWDNANGRLGIGTNVPAYLLDVNGEARINNTTQYIFGTARLQISTAGVSAFYANNVINWSSATTFTLQRQGGTVGIRINSTDNVSIGATTDGGQKFQVYGDTLLRGSGNTSATTALTVQNSDSTILLRVRNDSVVVYGSANTGIFCTSDKGQTITSGAGGLYLGYFATGDLAYAGVPSVTIGRPNNRLLNATSGTQIMGSVVGNFSPTSGTGSFTAFEVVPTINQTGGANGITRGLYVNPTLTSAADFRAIETTAGNVLFGSNFFWDNANGRLGIGTNAPAEELTVVGTIRSNAKTGADNVFFEGYNSAGTIVAQMREGSSIGLGGLAFNGQRQDATGGGGIFFNSFVGTTASGNNSAIEFRGTGGTIASPADLPSGIPIALFSKRSGGATVNQMALFQTGNLLLQNGGTFTDGGQRLQVIGDTLLRGSGATSATTALTVQNSSSTNLFTVRNDGFYSFRNSAGAEKFAITDNGVANNSYAFLRRTTNLGDIFQVFYPAGTISATNPTWNFGMNGNSADFVIAYWGGATVKNSMTFKTTGQTRFEPLSSAPASPQAGDVYYDSTLNKLRVYTTAWETITSV